MSTFFNILTQASRPARLKVMAKKVLRRFERRDVDENLKWLNENSVSFQDTVGMISPSLWQEACDAAAAIDRMARGKLSALPVQLGGGGATPYLYYLTRLKKPQVIVETGVAAGFSSQAFLEALEKNGFGRLFSSDFPYFRIADPEKYIGCIVDEHLKARWSLRIEGDETNIPAIVSEVERIDLFHYDSDKSYSGRAFAMDRVKPLLSEESIVVMDDIQDNSYFKDLVEGEDPSSWKVFRYGDKFVGLIGRLSPLGAAQ